MPCTLIAYNTSSCANSTGGADWAYALSLDSITAITVTDGVISAVTGTLLPVKLYPNKNQTCRYDETGERPNEFSTRYWYNCEGFAYFAGKSQETKDVGDALAACCQLVVFWRLSNGSTVIQGLEIDASATGGFTGSKEIDCRCTVNHLSDTAANESRLELTFNSRNRVLSPFTDLTEAEIAAIGD